MDAQFSLADGISMVEAEIMYFNLEGSQRIIKWGFWWRYRISDLKLKRNLWFQVFASDISEMKCHGWIGRGHHTFRCTEKHH